MTMFLFFLHRNTWGTRVFFNSKESIYIYIFTFLLNPNNSSRSRLSCCYSFPAFFGRSRRFFFFGIGNKIQQQLGTWKITPKLLQTRWWKPAFVNPSRLKKVYSKVWVWCQRYGKCWNNQRYWYTWYIIYTVPMIYLWQGYMFLKHWKKNMFNTKRIFQGPTVHCMKNCACMV